MKPSKYYLPLLAAVMFPVGVLHAADATEAFFYFEEPDTAAALDSSGNDFHLKYYDPKAVEVSQENPKFGSGSLKIMAPKGSGIKQSLMNDSYAKLGKEIRQMTVVAWIYLPAQIEENEDFVIMVRQAVGSANINGRWRFTMHNRYGLSFMSWCVGKEQFTSAKQKDLQPTSWAHYAMTFDEGMISLYVNGVCVTQRIRKQYSMSALSQDDESNRSNNIEALQGLPEGSFVDDFGFFGDTVLSGDDIWRIMEKGLQDFVKNR